MTCEAGKQGEGVVASAAPRPASCEAAADRLLAMIRPTVTSFVFDERIIGGAVEAESFAGILAEHAAALEEIRDQLREDTWESNRALTRLDQEITYVRRLAGLDQEESHAHED